MKICCKSKFRNNISFLQYSSKISPLHFGGRAKPKINTVLGSNEIVNNVYNENYTLGVWGGA